LDEAELSWLLVVSVGQGLCVTVVAVVGAFRERWGKWAPDRGQNFVGNSQRDPFPISRRTPKPQAFIVMANIALSYRHTIAPKNSDYGQLQVK
jgi:hypothetical protein